MDTPNTKLVDRRTLLRGLAATSLAVSCPAAPEIVSTPLFSAIGITAKVGRAEALKDVGADFIVESVADFLTPFADEATFARAEAQAKASPLPIRGCNSFLRDPSLICVGPRADHPRVLAYARVAFSRLKRVGGEYVVFGSSNARQVPEGWSKARADEQFVALLRAMATIAEENRVLLCVESLRSQECNYLNHVGEVAAIVAQVDRPRVRVLADLYHMRVMGDTPQQLAQASPWVGLVEFAEKERRTVPGVVGDDFRPYLAEIARQGFVGLADIEADGTPAELLKAFSTVKQQAADAQKLAQPARAE